MEFDENLSMYQAIKRSAQKTPLQTAIYYQGRRITFRRLVIMIDNMADVLANTYDIRQGDTVLLAQPNIPDVLVCFYAINKIGAIANLVHPFIPYNQLVSIYEKTNSSLAILFEQRVAKEVELYRSFSEHILVTRIENYLPPFKRMVYHVFKNHHIRKKLGKWRGQFKGFHYLHKCRPSHELVHEISNDKTCTSVLLHSGSTTGAPKTICLSNTSFNFISAHLEQFTSHKAEEFKGKAMVSILPSFHGFGLCMTMHFPLYNGYAVALVPKFSAKEVVKIMNHMQVANIVGIPGVYEALLQNKDFINHRSLKNFISCYAGGDAMNVSLKQRFDTVMKNAGSKCQVFEGYGLTESIAVVCVNTYDNCKEGSIGKPAWGVDFKIIDDDEKEVKRGELGEICTKSPALMLHYFKDEEATKNTFTKDGFLKTGDIGYMDEDDFVFFKQRKKRVVKVSGVGVFPSEIEKLIETVPGVKECCAISIPDKRMVSAIKVYVVAKYFDELGMKRRIIDQCQKYLIRWAVPKEIEFVNELPHTLLGKVDFKKLQQQSDQEKGI